MHKRLRLLFSLFTAICLFCGLPEASAQPGRCYNLFAPLNFVDFMTPRGKNYGSVFFREASFLKARSHIEKLKLGHDLQGNLYLAFDRASMSGLDVQVSFVFRDSTGFRRYRGRCIDIKSASSGDDIFEKTVVKLVTNDDVETNIPLKDIIPKTVTIERSTFPIPPEVLTARKASEAARLSGIKSLSHRTRNLSTLLEILKATKMARAGNGIEKWSGGQDANYFTLMTGDMDLQKYPEPFKDARFNPTLEFDVTLLDREDYFVNPSWDYGQHISSSMNAGSRTLRRFFYLYGSRPKQMKLGPEVVMWNAVDLGAFLVHIWVPKGSRSEILSEIRREGIPAPAGKSWDDLVVETDYVEPR